MKTVKSEINVKWVESTLMMGVDSRGQSVIVGKNTDVEPPIMGNKASDLLLISAAACSMYDVITILKKQKQPLENIQIVCTGNQLEEAPHTFISIHLHYVITGDVDDDKLERAIELSEQKYCSVQATLRPTVELTSDYEICK